MSTIDSDDDDLYPWHDSAVWTGYDDDGLQIQAPGGRLRCFCECVSFRMWYIEDEWYVCECGHRNLEHIENSGPCIGTTIVG